MLSLKLTETRALTTSPSPSTAAAAAQPSRLPHSLSLSTWYSYSTSLVVAVKTLTYHHRLLALLLSLSQSMNVAGAKNECKEHHEIMMRIIAANTLLSWSFCLMPHKRRSMYVCAYARNEQNVSRLLCCRNGCFCHIHLLKYYNLTYNFEIISFFCVFLNFFLSLSLVVFPCIFCLLLRIQSGL